ncbi:MAG TPA: ABC transporter permease [candidate division Zixibacteria bacterium]|nr:ABC transporter permease [candidate division Zixibacteria bacterium]
MLQLISRRLFFILLVCLLIVFFVNLGMRMIRNSEVPEPSYDLVLNSRIALQDTRAYLQRITQGDLGFARTSAGSEPILDVLKQTYINSMGLLLTALALAIVIGLPLGALAALSKSKSVTLPVLALTIVGISVPAFFAALLLRTGELYYVRYTGRQLVKVAGFGWDYKHMLLPVLVLAARPLAYLTRASFLSLRGTMDEDYIRTARAKGLRNRTVINIHAVPNIAVPVLTAIGVSLRFALVALPVVEFFFLWPGIGLLMLEAINGRQTILVVTLALALGLTFLVLNLFLDVAYWFVDPRIREANESG